MNITKGAKPKQKYVSPIKYHGKYYTLFFAILTDYIIFDVHFVAALHLPKIVT